MTRSELKNKLLNILTTTVRDDFHELSEDQHLQNDLQLDSLDLISMAVEVQSHFNVSIETEEVRTVATVGDLLNLLENKLVAYQSSAAA